MPHKLVDTTGLNGQVGGNPGDGTIGQPRDVTKTLGPDIVDPVPPYSSYDILLSHEMDLLKSQFLSWFEKEKEDTTWAKVLPPCPLKLVQDTQTGEPKITDTYPEEHKHKWDKPRFLTVFEKKYHPGAEWEIRSIPNKAGHSQQCCYCSVRTRERMHTYEPFEVVVRKTTVIRGPFERELKLIIYDRTEKTLGAGTPDKGGGTCIPTNARKLEKFWAHQCKDVIPFDWAYDLDKHYGGYKYRKMYMDVRPPNTGAKS